MTRLFLSYRDVENALLRVGLRPIEARNALVKGRECIPPHPHGMHSQRRWLSAHVERYCAELKQRLTAA